MALEVVYPDRPPSPTRIPTVFDDDASERSIPRKRPQQERSRRTVEAVVEAAAQLLEANGYDALTTNRVAERAGVSIGTLYQYFPDKAAVVGALVEDRLGREVQAMRAASEGSAGLPVLEAADRPAGAFVGLFSDDPGRSAAVLYGALRVRWRPVVDGLIEQAVGAVADRLRRAGGWASPETTAYVAVAAAVGVVARALAERPDMLRDGTASREVQAVVRGYLAERRGA